MVDMKEQIAAALRSNQLTAKEIAENIGENYKTVFGHLTQMKAIRLVELLDDKTYALTNFGISEFPVDAPKVQKIKVPAERLPPKLNPKPVDEIMKQPLKATKANTFEDFYISKHFDKEVESFETRITPINEKTVEEINRTVNYNDNVNSPPHYNNGDIECIDAIKASMTQSAFLGYCKGNVQKYMWRYEHKGGIESLKKAQWYLNKMIESMV
jgi:hypothetical protein